MESFINELYFGNIDPQTKCFKEDSQYGKAIAVISKNEELLIELLKDKELKLFNDLMDAWGEFTGVTECETFSDGFRIGAMFVFDTFVNKKSEPDYF